MELGNEICNETPVKARFYVKERYAKSVYENAVNIYLRNQKRLDGNSKPIYNRIRTKGFAYYNADHTPVSYGPGVFY